MKRISLGVYPDVGSKHAREKFDEGAYTVDIPVGRRGNPMTKDFYCDEALSGRTSVRIVRETDDVLAFHHTRPYWEVHVVVVPKAHVPSLTDLGGHDISIVYRLLDVVREIAAEVEAKYGGCRVATNLGRYQDSKHLHFHVGFGDPRK